MKLVSALIAACAFSCCLKAEIVINEIMYDPEGADTGFEWIELYNNGDQSVNLQGCLIQVAGASFANILTLPSFVLRPGRYVLIGEPQVSQATIIANLGLQNGGTATDGVRFVSLDGYTDTVLYDSPNDNDLTDDLGHVATSFAPDVAAGYSLARVYNGIDTNDSEADFIACASPSPGLPNPVICDYALGSWDLESNGSDSSLRLWILNKSGQAPLQNASLELRIDGLLFDAIDISPISPQDSTLVTLSLPIGYNAAELVLMLPGDPDTTNNSLIIQPQIGQLELILSEIMYYPEVGDPEWVEIYLGSIGARAGTGRIKDAAGNSGSFELPTSPGYYVLCADSLAFLEAHPESPPQSFIKTTGWPALNDSGDTIYLYDATDEEILLDSFSYPSDSTRRGYSLERLTGEDLWEESLSPGGSSPGRANAIPLPPPQISGRLELIGSPFKARRGEYLEVVYNLPSDFNFANCYIFDQAGRKRRSLADNTNIPAHGSLTWDGKDDNGRFLAPGIYFLVWESRSTENDKTYRKQKTIVING